MALHWTPQLVSNDSGYNNFCGNINNIFEFHLKWCVKEKVKLKTVQYFFWFKNTAALNWRADAVSVRWFGLQQTTSVESVDGGYMGWNENTSECINWMLMKKIEHWFGIKKYFFALFAEIILTVGCNPWPLAREIFHWYLFLGCFLVVWYLWNISLHSLQKSFGGLAVMAGRPLTREM